MEAQCVYRRGQSGQSREDSTRNEAFSIINGELEVKVQVFPDFNFIYYAVRGQQY